MEDISIKSPLQQPVGASGGSKSQGTVTGPSFGQMLKESVQEVNRQQLEANASIENLATGQQADIHQTMIAMEKASVSFELLMQIRNKVISAYENIMRTPI